MLRCIKCNTGDRLLHGHEILFPHIQHIWGTFSTTQLKNCPFIFTFRYCLVRLRKNKLVGKNVKKECVRFYYNNKILMLIFFCQSSVLHTCFHSLRHGEEELFFFRTDDCSSYNVTVILLLFFLLYFIPF